ncbi:MAG: acylphosphatase [Planctomycetota bacterium]|nr:acylphosphatase [Planctomycetota bacterium]
MERVQVRYEGRVQGIGFRITTHEIAGKFAVTGQVRNRIDGSVEMVAEGTSEELVAFLQAISAKFSRNIVNKTEDWRTIELSSRQSFDITATSD